MTLLDLPLPVVCHQKRSLFRFDTKPIRHSFLFLHLSSTTLLVFFLVALTIVLLIFSRSCAQKNKNLLACLRLLSLIIVLPLFFSLVFFFCFFSWLDQFESSGWASLDKPQNSQACLLSRLLAWARNINPFTFFQPRKFSAQSHTILPPTPPTICLSSVNFPKTAAPCCISSWGQTESILKFETDYLQNRPKTRLLHSTRPLTSLLQHLRERGFLGSLNHYAQACMIVREP